MNELISLSAFEMREGLLRGDFSAVELTKAHLRRIEETNPRFGSFITVCTEQSMEQAKGADATLLKEKRNSPRFTGIPVSIKDMIVTKDIETTCASKMLRGFIPPYESTAVSKLRSEGAIIIGKTNLDEFAMGASNENSSFYPVKNPWDETRVPGGTSGGSAVSVSLGQAPLSLGTDTGGSIRQPSGFTGVVGLKPTYGRVSRYGVVAAASSLDQLGPLARNIQDIAFILGTIAGPDPLDSTSMEVEVPNYLQALQNETLSLSGLRVGVPKEYFIEGIDKDVEAGVRNGIKTLEKLGAKIVEISLPHTEYAVPVYYIINPAEVSSNMSRYDGVRYGHSIQDPKTLHELYEKTRAEGFGPEVRRRILIGTYVLSAGYYDAYYLKAQQVRTLLINDFKAAFQNVCDVIAAPTAPTTAFRLGEKTDSPLQMYLEDIFTCPVNLAGLPGLTLPCGLDRKNLPIGLQLIGPPFSESKLLQVGHLLEKELQFDTRKMTRTTYE